MFRPNAIALPTRRGFLRSSAQFLAVAGLARTAIFRPAAAEEAPRQGGMLRTSFVRRPNHLNPLLHISESEYLLGEMMYNALTRLDLDMRPVPDLALSWQPNADVTEWTFVLRQGVRFHQGTEMTAHDVVASFEALLDEKTNSPGRHNVGPIDKVTDLDAHTVHFKLSAPYADLPAVLAHTTAKILPADVLARGLGAFDTAAFGTGPFKLKEFDPSRICRVERNPDYYVPGLPHLDAVEEVYYPDATAEISTFLSKDIDLLTEVQAPDFERIEKMPEIDAMRVASGRFPNIVTRCDVKPFDDVRVRQALALALDRELLVALVLDGFGQPAYDSPISSAYPYYRAVAKKKNDPQAARRLLAEAGYTDGLEVTLVAANSPPIRERLAVSARELAAPSGFKIQVQTMAYDTYLSQVWKKGNFYIGWYNMQPTPDGLFHQLYTSDAPWNETRWNNAEFDAVIAEARGLVDAGKRGELYGKAQEMMAREVPAITPVFVDLLAAKHRYVQGYHHHPRGAIYGLDRVWLDSTAPKRG